MIKDFPVLTMLWMNMARKMLVIAPMVLLCLLLAPAVGSNVESYRYLIQTGETCRQGNWRLEKKNEYYLTYETDEEVSVTSTDEQYRTFRWEYRHPGQQTDVVAVRDRNIIRIVGRHKGETMNDELVIDDAPWYQATSLSLRSLVFSSEQQTKFWIFRPDTLTLHQLVAKKAGTVNQSVLGRETVVEEINVSLAGLLSPFGSASYWFQKNDGIFVRYEGPGGLSGSPRTTVQLIGQF
jgi:hypothetical protein